MSASGNLPAITVALLEADGPELARRLTETAAQDYGGALQVLAIGARSPEGWVTALPPAPSAAAAVEQAALAATGEFLAILTPDDRPDPLWLASLVAASSSAIVVAPVLVDRAGRVLSSGLASSDDGGWRPEPKRAEAALGDGLLVSVKELRSFAPLPAGLDARSLGVEISLRAAAAGRPVVVAPRARVVVPAPPDGGGLGLDPRGELLLVAAHRPDRLARVVLGLRFGDRDAERARESKSKEIETKLESSLADLHRERAWSHTLGEMRRRLVQDAEEAHRRIGDLSKTVAAGESQLAETRGRLGETGARLSATESKLASTEGKLAATQAELRAEREARAAVERALAASRAETAALAERLAGVEAALADERRRHEETARRLARTEESLRAETTRADGLTAELRALEIEADRIRARIAERTDELARLRTQILMERDRDAERVTRLLEEVTRRRWRARTLSAEERSFLTGPGARFVRRSLRR